MNFISFNNISQSFRVLRAPYGNSTGDGSSLPRKGRILPPNPSEDSRLTRSSAAVRSERESSQPSNLSGRSELRSSSSRAPNLAINPALDRVRAARLAKLDSASRAGEATASSSTKSTGGVLHPRPGGFRHTGSEGPGSKQGYSKGYPIRSALRPPSSRAPYHHERPLSSNSSDRPLLALQADLDDQSKINAMRDRYSCDSEVEDIIHMNLYRHGLVKAELQMSGADKSSFYLLVKKGDASLKIKEMRLFNEAQPLTDDMVAKIPDSSGQGFNSVSVISTSSNSLVEGEAGKLFRAIDDLRSLPLSVGGLNLFPAKILMPISINNSHFNVLELGIRQREAGGYDVDIMRHEPYNSGTNKWESPDEGRILSILQEYFSTRGVEYKAYTFRDDLASGQKIQFGGANCGIISAQMAFNLAVSNDSLRSSDVSASCRNLSEHKSHDDNISLRRQFAQDMSSYVKKGLLDKKIKDEFLSNANYHSDYSHGYQSRRGNVAVPTRGKTQGRTRTKTQAKEQEQVDREIALKLQQREVIIASEVLARGVGANSYLGRSDESWSRSADRLAPFYPASQGYEERTRRNAATESSTFVDVSFEAPHLRDRGYTIYRRNISKYGPDNKKFDFSIGPEFKINEGESLDQAILGAIKDAFEESCNELNIEQSEAIIFTLIAAKNGGIKTRLSQSEFVKEYKNVNDTMANDSDIFDRALDFSGYFQKKCAEKKIHTGNKSEKAKMVGMSLSRVGPENLFDAIKGQSEDREANKLLEGQISFISEIIKLDNSIIQPSSTSSASIALSMGYRGSSRS